MLWSIVLFDVGWCSIPGGGEVCCRRMRCSVVCYVVWGSGPVSCGVVWCGVLWWGVLWSDVVCQLV